MVQQIRSNRVQQALAIVARLCLIVSLWHAPVPWLHCHGTSLVHLTSLASAFELSTHLTIFHPRIESNEERDLGWHWHWTLPSWCHALDDTPDDEPPAQEIVTFDQAESVSSPTTATNDVLLDFVLIGKADFAGRDHCLVSLAMSGARKPKPCSRDFSILRC